MSESRMQSRKNETNKPDFEVEKLKKPDEGQSLEFLESKAVGIRPAKRSDTLPRLPWQLERLVSAACADVLPKEAVMLSSGLVTDLGRYVLAWGCSYLVSDRLEAERRLWQVYRAWQGTN